MPVCFCKALQCLIMVACKRPHCHRSLTSPSAAALTVQRRGGASGALSPFRMDYWWVSVCRPCAVTISALSSWARQLCHIRKTTYPEDVTSQLSFSSFDCCICSAPISATFPESRRGQYRSVTQGWVRAHSYLVLWPIVSVCPIHCPVQAEASPPQAESSTNPCV